MEDYINTPKNGPGYAHDASIDTEAWLRAKMDADATSDVIGDLDPKWDNSPEILAGIERSTGESYSEETRGNVYNSENDFDFVFTFTVYAPVGCQDWCYAHDVFIAVCIHHGGDVRGNYGAPRVFRVDSPAEAGFLDWSIGWWADPETIEGPYLRRAVENGEFGVGYSSNPTSYLCEQMETDRGEWRDGAFYFEIDREAETYSPIAWYPSPF